MKPDYWLEVISRLSGRPVFELDDILDFQSQSALRAGPEHVNFERMLSRPSRLFWPQDRGDSLAIGIRISKPLDDPADLAGHLAALAAERGIMPIILSGIGACGLERFGFRIEDIATGPGQLSDELENQVRQFWKIDIVIDADDVGSFS